LSSGKAVCSLNQNDMKKTILIVFAYCLLTITPLVSQNNFALPEFQIAYFGEMVHNPGFKIGYHKPFFSKLKVIP